jgi:hypothetical protein
VPADREPHQAGISNPDKIAVGVRPVNPYRDTMNATEAVSFGDAIENVLLTGSGR